MIVYETIGATQDSLRCCIKGNCADCLFKPRNTDCIHRLLSAALSTLHRQENRNNHLKETINSQQADIERLRYMIGQQEGVLPEYEKLLKAEAIKEFSERMKEKAEYHENGEGWEGDIYYADDVDNLVEEMKNELNYFESEENNNA